MVEILSGASVNLCQNILKRFGFLFCKLAWIMRQLRAMLIIFDQFLSKLCSGKDYIRKTRIDGGPRHAVIFRLIRVLDHDQPTPLLNVFETHRAICSSTGENDRD